MPINRIQRVIDFELKTTESFNVWPAAHTPNVVVCAAAGRRRGYCPFGAPRSAEFVFFA